MKILFNKKPVIVPLALVASIAVSPLNAQEDAENVLRYGEDYFYAGALVPTCEVDVIRENGGKRADQFTANAGDLIGSVAEEPVSTKGCIDKLKDLAGYINMSWPSGLFNEGILDRIKDAACEAAEDVLVRTLNRQRLALSSPYGYAGVDLGIRRGVGGVSTEDSGTISERLERDLIRETKSVINTNGNAAARDLESAAGVKEINRDASKIRREYESDINTGIREGLDAI